MPKPSITPDKLDKRKGQGDLVTDPVVNGITIFGDFVKYDLGKGKGSKTFVGNGENEYLIFDAGNDTANMGGGDDIVDGGDDVLRGEAGNDYLFGDAGDDSLFGGAGDDYLVGGEGADDLDGGDGNDTVSYAGGGSVAVNLLTGATDGAAIGDTYTSIENLIGSAGSNALTGDANDNIIEGGTDTIIGFDTSDPAAGGDVIRTDVFPVGDLAAAVAGGYIDFASDGSGGPDILLDFDGGGDDFEVGTTLEGTAFVDQATSVALLANNFDFI